MNPRSAVLVAAAAALLAGTAAGQGVPRGAPENLPASASRGMGIMVPSLLDVAQAELHRTLSRDPISLAQVRTKLREIQALQADVEYAGIESQLKVIKLLTHEQHVLIMTIAASPEPEKPRAMSR